MILGRIRHQELSIRQRYIVADTIDYLTARFEFETEEWNGLTVWAHFKKDGVIYDIMLDENGEILESKHLDLTAGYWQVYLHGDAVENGETVQRITTDIAVISVAATGFLRGQPFPEMPASAAEQILAKALEAERLARSAHHPWATLERLRTYLYRVSFHDIPEYAHGGFAPAGCSSYVNGGKLYRNLDWKYSQAVSFVVVCKGFMGMAFDDRITEGNLDDDLIGNCRTAWWTASTKTAS